MKVQNPSNKPGGKCIEKVEIFSASVNTRFHIARAAENGASGVSHEETTKERF
jgi:hypothetical protein